MGPHDSDQCADDGVWSIYFNTVLLAKLDERDYVIRGWPPTCYPCCRTSLLPMSPVRPQPGVALMKRTTKYVGLDVHQAQTRESGGVRLRARSPFASIPT